MVVEENTPPDDEDGPNTVEPEGEKAEEGGGEYDDEGRDSSGGGVLVLVKSVEELKVLGFESCRPHAMANWTVVDRVVLYDGMRPHSACCVGGLEKKTPRIELRTKWRKCRSVERTAGN